MTKGRDKVSSQGESTAQSDLQALFSSASKASFFHGKVSSSASYYLYRASCLYSIFFL